MDTLQTFVTRCHSRSEGSMASRSLGVKDAQAIADTLDWSAMEAIAEEARKYLPAVLNELDTLKQAYARNPERVMRRAFLFGIATPNRDESQAIAWATEVEPWFDILSPHALAHRSFHATNGHRYVKLGMYNGITRSIAHGQCTRCYQDGLSSLESTPGCGPKVARMITAVIDPAHASWTVDLWHMRQLLWASGQDYRVRVVARNGGYALLENIWLTYAQTYFPNVPTFAVQWATWCVADGRFVSHHALWADLAG